VAVVRFRPRRVTRRVAVAPRFFFAVLFLAVLFAAFGPVRVALRLLIAHLPRGSSLLRLSYAPI
jgi:hypothetical protein